MTNQPAEEQLVAENETMQNVELKKTKSTPNYYLKLSYRANIMVHTIFVMLIRGTFCYCQTKEKLTVEPIPYNSKYVFKNTYELRETLLDLEEKTKNMMNHIRLQTGTIEDLRTTMIQNGSYTNAKLAQQILQTALEIYDTDKLGLSDFALLYTGGTIFNIPKTDPTAIFKYEISGFTVRTVYSEPTEMLKPDIIPGKCFVFLGDFGRIQIELSEKIVIYAVTIEDAHQAFIGEKIISAPKSFMVFSFQGALDDNLIELTFQYSIYGPARQTFRISVQGRMEFQFVESWSERNDMRVPFPRSRHTTIKSKTRTYMFIES